MNIIYKLTWQYMKKNRKRTKATILGIICTLAVLSAIYLFSQTLLDVIRSNIIEEQGGYHAIFHELDQEQYLKLSQDKKIKHVQLENCSSHDGKSALCARVELKKVNWLIFSTTQKIAEQLGMRQLPENERTELPYRVSGKYDVTYHMELLQYYGINQVGKFGVGVLINLILFLVMLMGSVLIYNAYAISTFEKLKYLGTLGSIGATDFQKASVVYCEGILEGIAGIPVGISAGVLLVKGIILALRKLFFYEDTLLVTVTVKEILLLVLLGFIMIFFACLFPAWKAVQASGLDLAVRPYTIGIKIRQRTNLLGKHRILGTVGMLAAKNIWIRRKNYISNGILITLSFCVILDGAAAMRGINGDYYPRDDRRREKLQLWAELYTMDQDKIEKFYQDVKDLPEVTSVSLERNLDWGGILLQPGQIQKDLQEFEISGVTGFGGLSREEELSQIKGVKDMHSGKWIEGYYLRTVIVGLDDNTFQNYVEAAGCQIPRQTGGAYSVLVEDYEEVLTPQGVDQRSILDLRPGDSLSFYYSRYGDMEAYTIGKWYSELDEIRQGNFTVIGTTQAPPPYPYFSGMQDNIDGYQERTLGICHIYMSMSDFKKLLKDPAYHETYGEHPTDTYASNYESKSIATYVKFEIKGSRKNDESGLLSQLLYGAESSSQMEKEKRIGEKIKKIAEDVGLTQGEAADYNYMLADGRVLPENDTFVFNSRLLWQRNQYFHSEKFFQLILGYGLVLLITILSLTNIFQNISTSMRMRRKEFSAYQSIGMSPASLRNMLLFEAAIYGVSGCLAGIPLSFLLLYQVYLSFKVNYALRWEMPWDMVPVQIVFAILIIVVPVVCAMSQLKNLNIIDSIRDENM
ncbi:ABC transporter permease [Lachnoclostridium sp. An118]|uniref:ABC transporter permease n=1 Tax=Lachnoclostridium sp. An118 TaxID=1965547 RepID=UPI000B38DA25|nr:ABC transporter permease [Lachnoclostridium sp. An118]OUQ49462.1 hypothetical protein B5E62_10560 [Lachnoclostridium sp. An118]